MSQEELARRLAERGVSAHATTIAKIEAGTRAIRLDEAAEIAELFGISLDNLFGHGSVEDDVRHAMKTLADTARNAHADLVKTSEAIVGAYELLRRQLDFEVLELGVADGAGTAEEQPGRSFAATKDAQVHRPGRGRRRPSVASRVPGGHETMSSPAGGHVNFVREAIG